MQNHHCSFPDDLKLKSKTPVFDVVEVIYKLLSAVFHIFTNRFHSARGPMRCITKCLCDLLYDKLRRYVSINCATLNFQANIS